MFACIHAAGVENRCLEKQCLETLVLIARGYAPLVEETSPDTVVVDLAGCERLFGPPSLIAREMIRRASESGLRVNVAIAANPDAAICAAHGLEGLTVIAERREAAALGKLPISLLKVVGILPVRKPGVISALPALSSESFSD